MRSAENPPPDPLASRGATLLHRPGSPDYEDPVIFTKKTALAPLKGGKWGRDHTVRGNRTNQVDN